MDPAAAPTDFGEFRVTAVLGQGGSGIVYDAQWGPRRVALKVLHPSLVGTERARAQFFAEARRLQTITHPSVVKVLAVGELPDGRPYLAMERLDGETLASVLARGPIVVGEALALFGQLCSAVGALHDQNLIHRDLKPENVYVVGAESAHSRHAVLLDFGIAKELEAPASTTTMDGGVRGTPAYMAPERFFGQPAGVATDIYELAVTLYAMLAGRLPWDDVADPEARLSPRPLVELVDVPAELDVEIRRAMSTRAQNRPASASALIDAVRTAAGSASSVPAPSETARMAPAAGDATKHTVTADKQPWFADRQQTTDRGKTPLAWAPTEAAPAKPAPPKAKRWKLAVAGVGVAAAAAGVFAWRFSRDDEPVDAGAAMPVTTAPPDAAAKASNDPWDQVPTREPTRTPPKLALTGGELSVATARAELEAALVHVPADTRVLFGVTVNELRKNEQFDTILGKLRGEPRVGAMLDDLPPCVQSVMSGAEWAIFASSYLRQSDHATLIIRGRWARADIESCFAEDSIPLKMPDGKTMLQLRRVGWIDFVDDHTLYLSVRDDLAAAQVHDLVKKGNGAAAHTKALWSRLPDDRALGVVLDGENGLEWPQNYLPKGSDLSAYLRVGETFSEFEVVADAHSEAEAKKLVAKVKPQFDELFKDKESTILGSVTVVREGTAMRIRGRMSSLMIAMIISQIP
ncbi:MAG TPA: serine/threonine-protein kinase [Kofleriaceae bacterium]|nr:serine/threonine-protein kinase [Kofleriaceae bacterium]